MSNVFAIASVTTAITQMLGDAIDAAQVTGANVTSLPPDTKQGLPNPGVNVFLYQISPNPSQRNADLPTRTADGSLLRRPQAALDLDYLITFYGEEAQLEQQRLLGAVVRALHAQPVISRTTLQFVQAHNAFLSASDLADAPDLVRLRPINFTLEELSKLWSFLLKVDYVLSIAYRAGVVLIDTDDPTPGPALPVLTPQVSVMPFTAPVIEAIAPLGARLIAEGGQVTLTGRNFILTQSTGGGLITAQTTVAFAGGAPQTPATLTRTGLTLALPAGLAAGPQTVQVTQSLVLGVPPTPHPQGFLSNALPFLLHPQIAQSSPGVYEIATAPISGGSQVTVNIAPAVQPGQRTLLELVQTAPSPGSHLFDAGVAQAATSAVAFDVTGLAAGKYFVRIRVDGAESPFETDANGQPTAPFITL
jgi:hypothetical protein